MGWVKRSGSGGGRSPLSIRQLRRFLKDLHEHLARQFSRLGVLIRGMIRGQEHLAVFHLIFRAMLKDVRLPTLQFAAPFQVIEVSIKPDPPESHNDLRTS